MCLSVYSKLRLQIYTYLGYFNVKESNLDDLIKEVLDEVIHDASFKYTYRIMQERLPFLNENDAYLEYLGDTTSYILSATTLGGLVDKKINRYQRTDMLRGFIYDACASAYIEYLADEYEREIDSNLSYRFCPGYQGTDVRDIRKIYEVLDNKALGLTLNEHNIIIPRKSMIGIVAYTKQKKSCKSCGLKNECRYLKEGMVCYQLKE